jgi:hypothetical protein
MVAVKTLNGESLLIKIETAPGSGIFVHDCLINTDRSLSLEADVQDILVPDCDDPTLPGWKQRLKDGLSGEISGAGRMHTVSLKTWYTWFNGDAAKNVRVETNGVTGANGGGYVAGAFKLTAYSWTGTRKQLSDVEVTLQSHGPLVWVDLP